jgi:hypothetical protein
MEKRTILILQVISILIEVFLIISIYLNGVQLSCDKCVINFESDKLGTEINKFSINITELYYNYLNGTCLVKYLDTQGYIYDINKAN